jgi:hypothetical protein
MYSEPLGAAAGVKIEVKEREGGAKIKKNTFPTKISYHQLIGTCREMCDAFPIESVFKSGSCHGASSCGGRPETGSRAE